MSIASRITSMTQHTKEAYDKIESLGADLTGVNKNLDNIADVLDDVYAGYPKVTGSGTSMSISNCKKAGMEIEYKGNTSQASTTGKNLLNLPNGTYSNNGITAVVENGKVTVNGTATATSFVAIPFSKEYDGSSITISANNSGIIGNTSSSESYASLRIAGQTSTEAILGNQNAVRTFQLNGTFPDITIRTSSGLTYNNFVLYPQLELGSSATEYEPYTNGASPNPSYPQDIHVVKGNNTVKVSGKNLFNVNSTIKENTLSNNGVTLNINQDGTISTSGTNTGTYKYIKYDITLPAGTYYFCGCPSGGNINSYSTIVQTGSTTASQVYDTGNGNTFTLSEQTTVHFYPVRVGSDTVNFDGLVFKPMIAKVQVSYNTYEPYQAPGSYPVNLRGKNLFDINLLPLGTKNGITTILQSDGSIKATGTNSSSGETNFQVVGSVWNGTTAKLIELDSSKTYTVKVTGNTQNVIGLNLQGVKNGTATKITYSSDSTQQATITGFTAISYISLVIAGSQTVNNTIYIQLEENSSPTEYESYYNYELCKLDTYQDKIRKSTGKNLFDKNNANILNAFLNNNSIIQASSNATTIYIPCKSSTTYAVQKSASGTNNRFCVFTTDTVPTVGNSSLNYIGTRQGADDNTSYTITTPANAKYLCVFLSAESTTPTVSEILNTIQVEENSSATEYEPYGKVWYKKNNISRIVLNGTEEGWGLKTSGDRRFDITTSNLNIVVKDNDTNFNSSMLRMSDRFIHRNTNHNYKKWGYYYLYAGWLVFHDSDSAIATLANFKTWLNNYNPKLYYVLANPTYTIITEQALIDQLEAIKFSMEGTTIITQTNEDKPFELSVSALLKQS